MLSNPKKFFLAAGLACGLATGAVAADDDAAPSVSARWMLGQMLWSGEAAAASSGQVTNDWTETGRIDDLLLERDGAVAGYVVDMGGFLGFGAYKVRLDTEQVEMLEVDDKLYLLTRLGKDDLQALPQFDAGALQQ